MATNTRAATPWYVVLAFLVALAAALMVALAGPLYRIGMLELPAAFTSMRWGVYAGMAGAALCLLAGIVALVRKRGRGVILALVGLIAAGAAVYLPISLRQTAQSVPPIHDISTDMEDPPAFVAVAPLRADAPNPVEYAGPDTAAQQKAAYPELGPATLSMPPDQAFARAESAAREMGWEIVAAEPAEGRIEATATTMWWGFKDDVVIRLRPAEGGTVLDVRSKSRVGRSDLGANAARIREFLAEVQG
ncbi:DUF1499 domain-containing protein [Indioceanicola profundi]|uniref:DUF1499 domain-containing protein n=1 Tax=Indioceanicola profundi TaxID=2220096 RepID=UPI000E6ABA1A|nr:DUF1499 domain-containing protein [Indioceanicola profundi]